MMPVVRLDDATFVDLKSIAVWLGTDTPSQTINTLVRERMNTLDLERDIEEGQTAAGETVDGPIVFKKTPGLSFTRILSASCPHRSATRSLRKSNGLACC